MSALSPAWDSLWAEAKAIPIREIAERLGATLRRAGADCVGPCPAGCASVDGFVVTPSKGIFLCRPSGESGDVIDLVVHAHGCTKAQALEFVTGRDLPVKPEEPAEERRAREAKRAHLLAAAAKRREQEERAAASRLMRDEEAIAAVTARAVPIAGTHAEAYLRARGLTPARRLTSDLRFVAELDYYGHAADGDKTLVHLATLPAMVAVIRDVTGAMTGIHQTYLDPKAPAKWRPIGSRANKAKKIRGEAKGGMIRLGPIGDKIAIGEGLESTLSWHALGCGPEDISIAAGISLGNLAGGWTGTLPHPTRKGADGKPTKIPNGVPDMSRPGVILPEGVREVILIGDGDSETLATRAAILTGAERFRAEGRVVATHFAPLGADFGDVLMSQHLAMEKAA
jgi:CHC2 zinc finger